MLRNGTSCERAYVTQLSPRASALRPNWMHGQINESRPKYKLGLEEQCLNSLLTRCAVAKATKDSVTPFTRHLCDFNV